MQWRSINHEVDNLCKICAGYWKRKSWRTTKKKTNQERCFPRTGRSRSNGESSSKLKDVSGENGVKTAGRESTRGSGNTA